MLSRKNFRKIYLDAVPSGFDLDAAETYIFDESESIKELRYRYMRTLLMLDWDGEEEDNVLYKAYRWYDKELVRMNTRGK